MEIREKGNLLIIHLIKGEDVIVCMQNIIRQYLIIDAKISGYGYFNRIEYGILVESDPLFFKKFLCEKLITASSVVGLIDNREVAIMINSIDQDNNRHTGKLLLATVELETVIILDIIKTK